jgi:hypothetical protein
MMQALLWKEYREHRVVWVALAAVSAAAILGLPAVLAPEGLGGNAGVRDTLRVLTAALAWTYGLVCGAMLLAGERENGTLDFLDRLPLRRLRLWWVKCLAGMVLLAGQAAVLAGLAAAAQLYDDWTQTTELLLGVAVAGLFGLAWGLLFSAFGRRVLNVILASLGGQLTGLVLGSVLLGLVAVVLILLLTLGGVPPPALGRLDPGWLLSVVMVLSIPAALTASAVVFSRPDRRRAPPSALARRRARPPSGDWAQLCWLAWRQARGFALGLGGFALALGLLMPALGVLVWPPATLVVGALCGVSAFADEQGSGAGRFLGDQRLPLGRWWLVKVGIRLLLAAAAVLVVLLPGVAVAVLGGRDPQGAFEGPAPLPARVFHTGLFTDLCPPGIFLTLWAAYGFSAGCLASLLFRNSLTAAVCALFLGGVLAGLWLPALLGGGLQLWQVAGPPLCLLAASRLVLRPWAAGRLPSWDAAARVGPPLVLAALWTAGGLWYRAAAEVPDVGDPFDVAAYKAGLPTPEENEAGRRVRGACLNLESKRRLAASQRPGRRPFGETAADRVLAVPHRGWPADDPELGAWMDQLFSDEWTDWLGRPVAEGWTRQLDEAAGLPPGLVEDPRDQAAQDPRPLLDAARDAAAVLAARGLQEQARGGDAAFPRRLRTGLVLARCLRRHGDEEAAARAREIEVLLLDGLVCWLEQLGNRAAPLREAGEALARHEAETPDVEAADADKVAYLRALNTLASPEPWLARQLAAASGAPDAAAVTLEAQWAATAWRVPWEQERHRRVLRALFGGDVVFRSRVQEAGPLWRLATRRGARKVNPLPTCWLRAARLLVALRLYQAEQGRPAEALDDLVRRGYLPAVPQDPFGSGPFHYRLSKGEEIQWVRGGAAPNGAPPKRVVPPGQGVLWSVGEDGVDDGGRSQAANAGGAFTPGEDRIFLVPLPRP